MNFCDIEKALAMLPHNGQTGHRQIDVPRGSGEQHTFLKLVFSFQKWHVGFVNHVIMGPLYIVYINKLFLVPHHRGRLML